MDANRWIEGRRDAGLCSAARHRLGRVADPAKLYNIVDAFDNEADYEAATELLGDAITDVATGLLVGGGTDSTPSGVFYASGCVPHACGGADAFMAVDPRGHKLYFAQQMPEPRYIDLAGPDELAGRRPEGMNRRSALRAAKRTDTMRKLISTGSPFEKTAGYSRAVVQGDWCFVSGTTGYDYATMTMPDSVEAQAATAWRRSKGAAEGGFAMADVVRAHYYVTDAASSTLSSRSSARLLAISARQQR